MSLHSLQAIAEQLVTFLHSSERHSDLDGRNTRIPQLAAETLPTSPPIQPASLCNISTSSEISSVDKMGIHHQDSHGRVFRGLEAKQHLEAQKRDSHSNKIKMHIPDRVKAAARPADPAQVNYSVDLANKDADVETVDSVVYVTMSKTFSGEAAGYVTLTDSSSADATQTATASTAAATSSATVNAAEASYLSAKSAASARGGSSTASSTVTQISTASVTPTSSVEDGHNNKSVFLNPGTTAAATTSSATVATALVGAGVQATRSGSVAVGTPLSATRAAQISDSSSGMSGGAKAGLAIGILLALALSAGLLFFCWRRRKNQSAHQEITDEKHASSIFGGKAMSEKHASIASAAPSNRSSRAAATAPRLSLRPVTQFLPTLGDRKSSANALDAATAAMSEKPKSMWERRANATENPFDDAAVMSEKHARPETPTQNPFDEPEGAVARGEKSPSNHSQTASWEGSEPATPKSTKFGTASAVAVAAAGTASAVPPVPQGANNVHRVQLDFKPSMEDELELKSGQLVRMLHEYDDGWVSETQAQ